MTIEGLKINQSKTNIMVFSKNERTQRFDINVEGDFLEEAKQIELLGVIFESSMRFAAQIQKI